MKSERPSQDSSSLATFGLHKTPAQEEKVDPSEIKFSLRVILDSYTAIARYEHILKNHTGYCKFLENGHLSDEDKLWVLQRMEGWLSSDKWKGPLHSKFYLSGCWEMAKAGIEPGKEAGIPPIEKIFNLEVILHGYKSMKLIEQQYAQMKEHGILHKDAKLTEEDVEKVLQELKGLVEGLPAEDNLKKKDNYLACALQIAIKTLNIQPKENVTPQESYQPQRAAL